MPKGDPKLALARTETPAPAAGGDAMERVATDAASGAERERAVGTAEDAIQLASSDTAVSGAEFDAREQDVLEDTIDSVPRRAAEPNLRRLVMAGLGLGDDGPPKIGRFTVLQRLGAGGMGVVYAAYDEQLDRKVAVKVLQARTTGDDETGRARLMREAQAMARLAHTNIVTVFEVGEWDDQVFLAMEFVRGETMDTWLGEQPRSWREILAVYLQAGRGLLAAHEAGLVHRDFKPHNAIVGEDGVVKVLDFGLARAADGALEERVGSGAPAAHSALDRALTRTGAVLGTPAYMAPEQHQGLVATAASDQFAFCVALYEALHGVHPFPCETMTSLVAAVLDGRVNDPPAGSRVPGWLHQVVVRGLSPALDRRHPSMGALLAALARDPAARRRRWLSFAGVAGVAAAVAYGVAGLDAEQPCAGADDEVAAVWSPGAREAARAGLMATGVAYAGDTWTKVEPQLDAFAADWAAMRTEACETHRLGRQSDELLDRRMACLERRLASLDALASAYAKADRTAVEKAVQAAVSLPPLARCGDAEALTAAFAPPEEPEARREVRLQEEALSRAAALERLGRYDDALEISQGVVARAETLAYTPLVAEAKLREGTVHMERGSYAAAERTLHEAFLSGLLSRHDEVAAEAMIQRIWVVGHREGRPREAVEDVALAEVLVERLPSPLALRGLLNTNMFPMYASLGDMRRAADAYHVALAARSDVYGPEHIETAYTHVNYGNVLYAQGSYEQALQSLETGRAILSRELGDAHPHVAVTVYMLGLVSLKRGGYARAQRYLDQALAVQVASEGPSSPLFARMLWARGELEHLRRQDSAAHEIFRRALSILEENGMSEGRHASLLLHSLADVERALGERSDDEALVMHERAMKMRVAAAGEDSPPVAESHEAIADHLLARDPNSAPATAHLRAALEIYETKLGDKDVRTHRSRVHLADALRRSGDPAGAQALLEVALPRLEELLPPSSPHLALARRVRGDVLLALARHDDALVDYRRARAIYVEIRDPGDPLIALVDLDIARARAGAGHLDVAAALADEVVAALRGREGYGRELAEAEAARARWTDG